MDKGLDRTALYLTGTRRIGIVGPTNERACQGWSAILLAMRVKSLANGVPRMVSC